jgi:uncharacterized repeat protein (TIGR01451 family)/uncharacterized repeat protein (TIGR02543 family)
VASFTNGDFDTGTLAGWTVATNRNTAGVNIPPATITDLKLAAGGTNRTSAVTGSPGTVLPYGLSAGASLRVPRYGNGAAVVNQGGASNNVNQLSQTMTITNADVDPADNKVHVRFALAPVLNSGGHAASEQPYFWVQLKNVTTGGMLYQTFNYTNQPGQPWKTDPANASVFYTDWQLFDISPGAAKLAVGDQVEMRVIAGGCQWGGHWGEIYVDAFGVSIPGLLVSATAPQQVNTGTDLTYTFSYSNGGTAAAIGTKVDVTLPGGTNFVSFSAPGATCTAPVVGGTGVVSCNVGNVNPAASGSLTVTVHVTAGAGATVALGTYQISASGVSALLGPLVNTTVTSGAVYADLGITKTDGVAAATWGDPLTYTIVATNHGPGAAEGATVTDTMPAQLTGVTWTCAAIGGAACGAASGSGNISQAVPTFPSGGAVTYTVSATVNPSGSGTATLTNQATVTAPGGVSDNYLANNDAVDTDALGTLYGLTLQKSGTGDGSVVSSPAAISCGLGCTSQAASFLGGTSVVLTASAAPGYAFNGWTGGGCLGAQATCTVLVASITTVTADFGPIQWPVTGSAPGGNGTVACTSPIDNGLTSTCTITPAAGYQLTALTDNGSNVFALVSGSSYVTSAVTSSRAVVGTFTLSPARLVVSPGTTTFTAPSAPLPIDPALSLTQGSTLSSATVSISTGLVAAQDRLLFTTQGGITGSYDAAKGILTLSGTASVATYQAALRSVAYGYAGPALVTGPRQVTFSVGAGLNFSGNGHFYEFVSSPGITWDAASTAASARRYFGLQGYLATVTSAAENAFIAGKLTGEGWMGLSTGSTSIPRTWSWVTGPEAGTAIFTQTNQCPSAGGTGGGGIAIGGNFTNWASGEPNNCISETKGHFLVGGQWNDYSPTNGSIQGYVVEYGGMAGDPTPVLSGVKALQVNGIDTVTFLTDGTPGATLTGATAQYVPRGGDATAVTANYPYRSHFVGWTGTGGFSSTSPTITVTGVAGDLLLTANFAPDVCGNGVVEPSETCDDGNAAPGDGCSATCQVETGWSCPTANAACSAICGDGLVVGLETCDDGNARSGDGCTDQCQVEFGYTCPTPGVACLLYAADLRVFSGSLQHGRVGEDFPAPVCVEVLDVFAAPLPAQTVTFAALGTTASAAVLSPLVSDSAGLACTVATANTKVGSYLVHASVTPALGPTLGVDATLTNDPGYPARHVLLDAAAANQHVVVGHPFADLAVTIFDRYDNLVPDAPVDYVKSGATGGFLAILESASASTSASGVASVRAVANNFVGSETVGLNYGSVKVPAVFTLSAGPDVPAAVVADWQSSPQTALVGGDTFAAPIGATVKDKWGNVVPNVSILFRPPSSGPTAVLHDGAGAMAFTATTDAGGHASLGARSGDLAGPYQVSATVGALAATFALTNATDPAGLVHVAAAAGSGAGQHATVSTAFATALSVAVSDVYGNPVPGVAVTFAAPASGATASLTPATSQLTDLRGLVTVTATANGLAGSYQVTASTASGVAPVAFPLTNDPGAPARLVARADTATQAATVGTTFTRRLVVTVYDAQDNLVPGAAVAFSAPAGGPTAGLSEVLPVSDASGEASVEAVAGSGIGAYTVAATAPGTSGASFQLSNLPGAPGTMTIVTGSGQEAVVDAAFEAQLQVLVRDRFGNPVPGVTVAFAGPTTQARALLSAASAVTDAQGRCAVSATAGQLAGAYLVTAAAAGVAAPVQFGLQNQPGSATAMVALPSASGQATPVGEAFAAPVGVSVRDLHGNAVPGATVLFACPEAPVTCTLDAASVVSDVGGRAWVKAVAGERPGALQATASLGVVQVAFGLTSLIGPPGAIAITGGGAQQVPVFGRFGAPLDVRVVDRYGNAVVGAPVAFELLSTGPQGAALSGATVTTASDGSASVSAAANFAQGSYAVLASAPGVLAPVRFELSNAPLQTSLAAQISLPVTATVVGGQGVTHVRLVVDTASGRVPSGTVTLRSSTKLQVVSGQAGVSQSGDAVVAVLDRGSAEVDVQVSDWQSRTLTADYTPDVSAAPTFTPATITLPFAAPAPEQTSGGCGAGGVGSLAALLLVALALSSLRRPRSRAGRALVLAVVLAAVLLPAIASAEVALGLRIGYASASGSAITGSPMSEGVSSGTPIQVDLGWRLIDHLTLGAYYAWAPASAGSLCSAGSCSASFQRLGVQASWRFDRLFGLIPWAGAGVGWEQSTMKSTQGSDTLELVRSGWELLNLQLGADLPVAERFAVGPFLQVSLARYGNQEVTSPLGDASGGISEPSNHTWVQLGLRGTFDL